MNNDYRVMLQEDYIREFCENNYSIWLKKSKKFKRYFTQRAYTDETVWVDDKNKVVIENRYYICD